MRDSTTNRLRRARLVAGVVLGFFGPSIATAQPLVTRADSVRLSPSYWPKLVAGAASSILAHEAAHIITSYAVGGKPTFGFDNLRPTVYSGIHLQTDPRKQFYFSASGLVMQSLLDEAILDIPHHRGGAFERGLLGGGIGTTVFYLTIGRWGSVSDVDFIARTHVMNKTQVSLVFGSIVAAHVWRITRDPQYDHFFFQPSADGLRLGWSLEHR
jgi:hypothetical protein